MTPDALASVENILFIDKETASGKKEVSFTIIAKVNLLQNYGLSILLKMITDQEDFRKHG